MYQAQRNTQEAVSMFQVAEGTLSTISDMSIRLEELAVQAANDTLDKSSRLNADREFQSIKNEIKRLSESTSYNGRKLINNSGGSYTMQIGIFARDGDRLQYDLSKVIRKSNAFGAGGQSIRSKESAQNAIMNIKNVIEEVSNSRALIGSMQSRMTSAYGASTISSENLEASKSKIRDTDFALETANQAKSQIIKDSSISSLKYINDFPSFVTKLVD